MNYINNKYYENLDSYMSTYYMNENDFFDYCINKIGKGLKYIGNKTLEFLKKKYMIGKYSINYKKKINSYKIGKNIYKECVNLYYIIFSDDIINPNIISKYIKLCKQLNKVCSNFKEELPEIDYKNPEKAISNFEEVENYINMLNNRKHINNSKLLLNK